MSNKHKQIKVTHRFGDLKFPQDRFGITGEIKKAIIKAATKMQGHPEKLQVYLDTMAILSAFVREKFRYDNERREKGLGHLLPLQTHGEPEPDDEVDLFSVD